MNNMNKFLIGILALLLIGGLVYWGTNSNSLNNKIGEDMGMEEKNVRDLAVNDLAGRINVSLNDISVIKVESRTWTDGCLGLGGPAEICLQALVDGYRIELQAQGTEYVYRTDLTGESVRLETQ